MSKYRERIDDGLCGLCGKKSDNNICDDCKIRSNEQRRSRRLKNRLAGKCLWCSGSAVSQSTLCESCKKGRRFSNIKSHYRRRYGCGWEELVKLYQAQNKVCAYSGLPITIGVDAELDHIIPKSKNGFDATDNYQWVHCQVNRMKCTMLHEEFIDLCTKIANNFQG
jgi:5-methylcytosine-specific restriction endonuclease McrA